MRPPPPRHRAGPSGLPGLLSRRAGRAALPCAAALLLAACASPPPAGPDTAGAPRLPGPDRFGPTLACERLAEVLPAALPGVVVELARRLRSTDEQGHPPHCLLRGRMAERPGQDGETYAIGFELRLPAAWNGRFLHQANSGLDGSVAPAFGALAVMDDDALSRGFAVLSANGGHDADDPRIADAGLARAAVFGLDPEARRQFAHGALDAVWPLAQAAIARHYGRAPLRSYLAGCGNGGRLGLLAATRFPERYDGIVAGAPAIDWPRAALQHAWDLRQWLTLDDDIRRALSPADMQTVAQAIVARCDGLDLVADGMVGDPQRCQQVFRLSDLACRPAAKAAPRANAPRQAAGAAAEAPAPACLPDAKLQALAAVFAGPHDGAGRKLYTDWWWDPGIAAAGWRHWRIESDEAAWGRLPVSATLGSATLAQLFTTPPVPVAGTLGALLDHLADLDLGAVAASQDASSPPYAMAMREAMGSAPGLDADRLEAFAARGGKLLVYHGVADPVLSVQATIDWAGQLQGRWGLARADGVLRMLPVPGMGHCRGGPATDRFDALGAVVDWVERGQAPDRLLAQVDAASTELPAAWRRTRSRPLCAWPRVLRYRGGDVEAAASFHCVPQ